MEDLKHRKGGPVRLVGLPAGMAPRGGEVAISGLEVRITPARTQIVIYAEIDGHKTKYAFRSSPVSICGCHRPISPDEVVSTGAERLVLAAAVVAREGKAPKVIPHTGNMYWNGRKDAILALEELLRPLVQHAVDNPPPREKAEEHIERMRRKIRVHHMPALAHRIGRYFSEEAGRWADLGGTKEEFEEAVKMALLERVRSA